VGTRSWETGERKDRPANGGSSLASNAMIGVGMVISLFDVRLDAAGRWTFFGASKAFKNRSTGVRHRLATRRKLCVALYDTGSIG
jgi:hypothetical protein